MKNAIVFLTALGLLLVVSPVSATPANFVVYNLSTNGVDKTLVLPSNADNSPVISLGSAIDPASGKTVEGHAIVHYKDEYAKGGNKGGDKGGKPSGGGSSCYTFLASGAKWKTVEPWVLNPSNIRGLDAGFVLNNFVSDIVKWEDASGGANILGDGLSTLDLLVADTTSPDGVNEVYFADISSSGAIGVTIVWGIFGGRPASRELLEWDMILDDVDYDWSQTGEAGKMDFESIATHELGHAVGLGDLYDAGCAEETMYGYADFGETNKRDLNAGDITGISKLY